MTVTVSRKKMNEIREELARVIEDPEKETILYEYLKDTLRFKEDKKYPYSREQYDKYKKKYYEKNKEKIIQASTERNRQKRLEQKIELKRLEEEHKLEQQKKFCILNSLNLKSFQNDSSQSESCQSDSLSIESLKI